MAGRFDYHESCTGLHAGNVVEESEMRRHLRNINPRAAILVFALSALVIGGPLQAQTRGLVSSLAAQQVGLERSWYTQVNVDSGRGQLRQVTPYVSQANAFTLYEVAWETGKEKFSELDRDPFGDPKGPEVALEEANARIMELKKQGFDPKLITSVVPEVTLYAVNSRGGVDALDGETGRLRWSTIVGNPDYATLGAGVNEDYVAVVNGSTLYVVERATGAAAWQRKLGGAPGASPVISEELVIAPLMNGKVETYKLTSDEEDEELKRKYQTPKIYVSIGRIFIQPTVTPTVCAWPTDRGFMYVVNANKEGMRYRVEADDTVVSRITYDAKGRSLMMASVDGYLYNVDESSGNVIWRFSAGAPIAASPAVVRNDVFLVTDTGGLYCLDAETGLEKWWTPRVQRYLTASDARVYCTDLIGRLLVIDAKSGGRIASLPTEQLSFFLTNHDTDRIYLGTSSGLLQCLHEPHLERPLIYTGPGMESPQEPKAKAAAEEGGSEEGGSEKKPAATENPFGTGGATPPPAASDDPFGAGAGGGSPSEDPFGAGGGSTPPGGGSTPPDDNPFGASGAASDNPFG
jgi:outer membrane protein assembly factor BamB